MLTLTSDPIIPTAEITSLVGRQDENITVAIVNAVSAKFLRFTNRIRINSAADTVERIRPYGGHRLWLHAFASGSPVAKVYVDNQLEETYTVGTNDIALVSTPEDTRLELYETDWPSAADRSIVEVTYTAGWSTVPGDVVAGAVMQARVELRRLDGEAGIISTGARGENKALETEGLVKAVREAWQPYKVMV